jgi:mannose-6-phosphate isomerase-like protein (cupin superfamily)
LLVDLQTSGAEGRSAARAQNFIVERLSGEGGRTYGFSASSEVLLLLPNVGAMLGGDHEAALPGHAIAILPGGSHELTTTEPGEVYVLSTDRLDAVALTDPTNGQAYRERDGRVRPVGQAYARVTAQDTIRVYRIEDIAIPPDNGRLRFLQSATMSINWVEYEGVRDRSGLTPHSHADAEQASLAIEGQFVHHLRTPWGRDAEQWRDDQHLSAGPATAIIIPPEIIHTTEGVGEGRHVLVDIFAPPRQDFIARNWVFNAAEYTPPEQVFA